VMVFLEDTDDWNAVLEALRRAGFHAIKNQTSARTGRRRGFGR
jgi:hypothetical protein